MKCDELETEQWLDYGGEPMPCYPAKDVDEAIAELKSENRRLKRALWMARAKEAWSNARWFNLCNPYYVRNRQGFTPNNENQKQMDSIEWARLFYNNYKKLIAKAEEYK